MTVTMDAAGRLVIPKEVRREASLEPGMPLEIRWRDGVIEIEPQPLAVSFTRRGRLLVAEPRTPVPALGGETVERTTRAVRNRQGRR